jgi:post-segregation antitoxin (ccd killing protein)
MRTKSDVKKKMVMISISVDLYEQIKLAAIDNQLNISSYIAHTMNNEIKKENNKKSC